MGDATNERDPADAAPFDGARGLRLVWRYGDWRGRVASQIVTAIPSERDAAAAFVLTQGGHGGWWHRVDLATGAVVERRDLGLRRATPVDVIDDGARVLVLGEGSLRLRTHDGEHVWKRGGGWQQVALAPTRGAVLAVSAQGTLGEIDLATGALVRSFPGRAPFSVARDGRWLMHAAKRQYVELRDLDARATASSAWSTTARSGSGSCRRFACGRRSRCAPSATRRPRSRPRRTGAC